MALLIFVCASNGSTRPLSSKCDRQRTHVFANGGLDLTADFADRVGHDFHHRYAPEPNSDTYLTLLDLVDTTRAAIASSSHATTWTSRV
jgi:hypothetical protein